MGKVPSEARVLTTTSTIYWKAVKRGIKENKIIAKPATTESIIQTILNFFEYIIFIFTIKLENRKVGGIIIGYA